MCFELKTALSYEVNWDFLKITNTNVKGHVSSIPQGAAAYDSFFFLGNV